MRLADLVLADRVKIPPLLLAEQDVDVQAKYRSANRGAQIFLQNRIPVIEASLVADQVFQSPMMELGDFPCLAPPWPQFWMEYTRPKSASQVVPERWGLLVVEHDIKHFADLAAQSDWPVDAERSFSLTLYTQYGNDVFGPTAIWNVSIDDRALGVGYDYNILSRFKGSNRDGPDPEFSKLMFAALQTITFLHCRNVHLVEGPKAPPKVQAKREKKLGRPLLGYSVVRIDPFRSRSRRVADGEPEPTGRSMRMHTVPGHFAHFGDCCPGVHEPHGKAFGKLTGMFWSPPHVRGDLDKGAILHDYEVKPSARVPARS